MKKILIFFIIFIWRFSFSETKSIYDFFIIKNYKNNPVNIQKLKGNNVLIFFWSSQHSHCIKRLVYSWKIHKKYQKKGLITVSVGLGNRSIEKAILEYRGFNFNITGYSNNTIVREINFHSIPFYMLLSKTGKIIYKGYKNPSDKELSKHLK